MTAGGARRDDRLRSASRGTALAGISLLLYVVAVSGSNGIVRELLLAIAYASVTVAVCVTRTWVRGLLENRLMLALGYLSYSIFLIHQPTVRYISELARKRLHLGGPQDFLLLMTIGFLVVVGVSRLFFVAFERPFLNAPSRARTQIGAEVREAAPR